MTNHIKTENKVIPINEETKTEDIEKIHEVWCRYIEKIKLNKSAACKPNVN